MKNKLILTLAAVLCVSLCACGASSENQSGNKVNKSSVLVEKDNMVCIKREKFSELLERIELTTENWKDYVHFYSCDEEVVHKDAFGEIISTETITHYCIGAGNQRYHQFQDAIIELKNKETGELTIYNLGYDNTCEVPEDFNLDNYDCTRAKGRLYFVDIPLEALHSPLPALGYDWGYDTGFYLVTKGMTTPYRVNAATKGIEQNGGASWDDFLKD